MEKFINILERFGPNAAIIGLIALGFWKLFWPWFVDWNKEQRLKDKEQVILIKDLTTNFLKALDKRDAEFSKLTKSIDKLTEEHKRSRERKPG